jgi:hypothetical protein
MSNLTLRQTTTATDPGSTSAKGSALSHTELDSNLILLNNEKLENLSEDTSPQLGANLDVNNFTINNAGGTGVVDFDSRASITENVADYSLLIDNQNTQGLGVKIKAGDDAYAGSLAILSVADKDDTLVLTAKADGAVIVYENLSIGKPGDASQTYITSGSISTLNSGEDLNITTNSGTLSLNSLNFPGSDGTANQILQTDGAGNLSFADKIEVVDDTTPQLGGALDLNGQMIGPDSTRDYQMYGNQASPSSANYDSFNQTGRQYGPVRINEVTNPSNRVHSNMNLSLVTYTADAGSQNSRLRHNYFESVVELDGHDNTRTGFGSGHNGIFASSMARNSNASNNASLLAQQTGLTITPQVASTSTGGLTVTDMRAINMEPNINDANGTVTTLYGMYYNTNNAGTITNQYSFYGAEQPATIYNQGGMELPSFTVANLTASSPVQVTRRTGNMVFCTDETGGAIPCFWDGSDWRRMSDRAVIS